uniref:THAP domain-containing protein 9 n=1 Tax=Sipha flava TaxID=143950 RepID=A0A2S2R0S0_9HEMI
MDEIAIRKCLEFDGLKYHGFVDYGLEIDSDAQSEATECFVFMVTAINASWKLPVGYFFVVSHTFDGCAVNVSMAKALGCKLASTPQLIKSDFNAFNDFNVNIIFDPAHMVKLVRNTFGEKR